MSYDSLIITLILIVDLISMYYTLKADIRRHKARTAYKFNKILKTAGII